MAIGVRTFMNLVRGTRVSRYIGLSDEGPHKYGPDYTYIELPMEDPGIQQEDGKLAKFLRNQSHVLSSGQTVRPAKGYKLMVSVNPKLQEYADAPTLLLIHHEGDVDQPLVIHARFRKDMPVGELEYLFRVSLLE